MHVYIYIYMYICIYIYIYIYRLRCLLPFLTVCTCVARRNIIKYEAISKTSDSEDSALISCESGTGAGQSRIYRYHIMNIL